MNPNLPYSPDRLDDLEFQYGPERGKLAMAMELLVDAEISAGQLGIYCRNAFDARKAHPDAERLAASLSAARALLREAFTRGGAK